jgi:hypothetical protein
MPWTAPSPINNDYVESKTYRGIEGRVKYTCPYPSTTHLLHTNKTFVEFIYSNCQFWDRQWSITELTGWTCKCKLALLIILSYTR